MLRKIVLRDSSTARWMIFSEPVDVLIARNIGEVIAVVEQAGERVSKDGLHAAGFLSYESAPAFDAACVTHPPGEFPLACFGLFHPPRIVTELPAPGADDGNPLAWHIDVERGRYREKITEIRQQIALGNTYQVNYTVRQHAKGAVDAWRLFHDIATDAPYAAFVDLRQYAIVSASPELFFELSGHRLTCRPMKGTAARALTAREDERIRETLVHSAKDRAENVMIADMVRNDVGRIAIPGSVRASSLFDVEKYRTVWQMTSTITATTHAPVSDIFRALFPSASITGAPKVSSMRLIAGIEQTPRQVYTGCIGFQAPGRRARFNVAIRTAIIDRHEQSAVYGVGGGIVWDSDADSEYQECLDKARVLKATGDGRDFELLETLLWTREQGVWLLDEHLQRLADSARYFDFRCDREQIGKELRAFTAGLGGSVQRIRLLLEASGASTFEARELPEEAVDIPLRVRLADQPIDPGDPFLYHKTTRRDVYQRALSGAGACDDVLLWNTRGEVTESTIANVVVRMEGGLYTPPVECGLLAGTMRQNLIEQGKVTERVVRIDELPAIDELYLVNSVRGWRCAIIAGKSTAAR